MKKFFKVFGIILLALIIILIGINTYVNSSFPDVGSSPELTVKSTPELIERGEYLVNNVTACMHCHAERDFTRFSGPKIPGSDGKGGFDYTEAKGFPGNFYASNITPHNLSNWTDGEIYRAISSGVKKDGEPIFPLMPYSQYKIMDIDDAKAIIAYLRTLKSIDTEYPKSDFSFPFSWILRTIPQKAQAIKKPDSSDTVKLGEYLTAIGACQACHTLHNHGGPVEGMIFAGGYELPLPHGAVNHSANITPDIETGIGAWSREQFIAKFKYYENNDSLNIGPGDYNSEMPWMIYAGMTEADLGAIYDYLRTIKPVKNLVEKFTPMK